MMRGTKGFGVIELLLAIVCLGFVLRPVDRTSTAKFHEARADKIAWEVNTDDLQAYLEGIPAKLESKWAGLDRKFGYNRGSPVNVGKLIGETVRHSMPLVTAGFVSSEGRVTANTDESFANFERGMQGVTVAFFDAAQEGMRR